MSIATGQRFNKSRPCPICGGYDAAPRGAGQRCGGFLSDDGKYAHCMREEHAGTIEPSPKTQAFAHRLEGLCRCGKTHSAAPVVARTYPRPPTTPTPTAPRRIVATYDYRDEHGQLLFQAVRYDPKNFSQRRPDGHGGWIYNLEGVRRTLYRLPELLAADPFAMVYLVEGEKDVDRLRNLGLVATCNPQGALKWRPEYADAIRDRHVVMLPDNDDTGQRHTGQVAAILAGAASSVQVLDLPDLPAKGDVSDWLNNGGTREQLERLAVAAPLWIPPVAVAPPCDAQDASHNERPDLAGVREDIVAYIHLVENERDGYREETRALRRERNEERDRYRLRLGVLRNRTIKPAARLAIVGLANELEHVQRQSEATEQEAPHVFLAAVAEESGLSERTVGNHVEEITKLGLCEKETTLHRATKQTEDGQTKSVLFSELRIRPLDGSVTAMLRGAASIVGPERHHGGERKPLPKRCPDHPDAPIVADWRSVCTVCGQIVDKGILAHPPVSCDAQDASHSEGVEETFGCDAQDASPESSTPTVEATYMHAQDASHSTEDWPPVDADEDAEPEEPDAPEDGRLPVTAPSGPVPWYMQAVCITCRGPLPPGRTYYCDGCTPTATAPPLDEFDALGVTA